METDYSTDLLPAVDMDNAKVAFLLTELGRLREALRHTQAELDKYEGGYKHSVAHARIAELTRERNALLLVWEENRVLRADVERLQQLLAVHTARTHTAATVTREVVDDVEVDFVSAPDEAGSSPEGW